MNEINNYVFSKVFFPNDYIYIYICHILIFSSLFLFLSSKIQIIINNNMPPKNEFAKKGTNETNMSNNNNEYAIESVAFSENGYHISSIATNGTVTVWDLRKQKVIKTLEEHSLTSNEMASNFALKEEMQKKEANSLPSKKKKKKSSSSESPSSLLLSSLEPPRGLSFCPEGRHLAYGTAKGAIVIASCKEWDRPVVTLNTATTTSSKEEPGSFSVQDMVWIRELLPDDDNDDNKKKRTVQLLASCGGEGERVVKFWGAGSDNEGDRE